MIRNIFNLTIIIQRLIYIVFICIPMLNLIDLQVLYTIENSLREQSNWLLAVYHSNNSRLLNKQNTQCFMDNPSILNENASQSQLLSSSNASFVYKLFSWQTSMNKVLSEALRLQHICYHRHWEWLFSIQFLPFFLFFIFYVRSWEYRQKASNTLYFLNVLVALSARCDI